LFALPARLSLILALAVGALLAGVSHGGFGTQAGPAKAAEYPLPTPTTTTPTITTPTTTTTTTSAPAPYLTPVPIVRLVGTTTRTGARISMLRIRSPRGSTVTVRCHGGRRRGCTRKSQRASSPGSRLLRFRRYERRVRAGVVLEVFVTKGSTIGKYTSFRIRRHKAPSRNDECLSPGDPFEPGECP
jgi:hypothetical protein